MKLKDVIGVLASIGVSVVGLIFAPRPYHGWGGTCPWSIVFPPDGSLWPDESWGAMFDGCATGSDYKFLLISYLSLVFLTAGALASRVAEQPSRSRGAVVNAVFFASTLAVLTVQEESGFSVLPTLILGIVSVAGAAGLGFIGGPRAEPGA